MHWQTRLTPRALERTNNTLVVARLLRELQDERAATSGRIPLLWPALVDEALRRLDLVPGNVAYAELVNLKETDES